MSQCLSDFQEEEQPETPYLPGMEQKKIRLPLEIKVPKEAQHMRYSPSVKIDALYKPILRRFRAFFRSKFDCHHNVKHFQHWTANAYIKNVQIFMTEDLKLPETLLDIENIVKMITLLFPCSLRKKMPTDLEPRSHFAQVFRENN